MWKVGLWEVGRSIPGPRASHPCHLCPLHPPKVFKSRTPPEAIALCSSLLEYTHRPQGSPRWKPVPTASLMNCDVLEPSSPTTARFPLSSISVLAVRAQPGIWVVGGAAKDCEELGVEDRSGEVGCKAVLGLRKYPRFRETQTDFICTLQSSCVRLLPVFHLYSCKSVKAISRHL